MDETHHSSSRFAHRGLEERDLAAISGFPQTVEELFYMGPSFVYPLTPEQIKGRLVDRKSPTVFVGERDKQVAYANLYDFGLEEGVCWLGNVIVSPEARGAGIADYLVETMMERARLEHGVIKLKLYCHNPNTRAMLLYMRHGFIPCGGKTVGNHQGDKIVSIAMERQLLLR